jgi:hypothetical protein
MEEKIKQLQKCLESMYKAPDDNLGWSFDYSFLKSVAEKAGGFGEQISMEQLDSALLSILNLEQQ